MIPLARGFLPELAGLTLHTAGGVPSRAMTDHMYLSNKAT